MNIRLKIFSLFSVICIFFIAALYYISSSVLLHGFINIEDEQSAKNVERFKELLKDELENLTITSVGWSSWDDSFEYVKKPNANFINKNFRIDTLFDSKFKRVMYFNLAGNTLFSLDYDILNRKYLVTHPSTAIDFQTQIIKNLKPGKLSKPIVGFFKTNTDIEYFSLNPILPSTGTGAYNGYLVFFRSLDATALDKYKRILKLELKQSYSAFENINVERKDYTSLKKNKNEVIAKLSFIDYLKRGELIYTISMPRKIYLHGESTIWNYMMLLLVIVLVSAILSYNIFDNYIIKRILKLNVELQKISEKNSLSTRVEATGSDEIGNLALGINTTLNSLDQKQLIINRTSKFSALGEVAASIAHEINNPLTVVAAHSVAISKLIEADSSIKSEVKDEVAKKSQKIKDNVQRIEKIIKSLRFIARDGDNDALVVIQVGEVFEDVKTLCIETLKHKSISLDVTEFDSSLLIKCRPVQIAQVFVNLINNSIDALEGIENPKIKISTIATTDKIIVSVSDNGPIIPETIAARMMDPFFTTKSSGKGTGLGLSISKTILESHGGCITLETLPQTRFNLEFPKN